MSDISLSIKAPFIDAATEAYLQTILPGYEVKEETEECIELRRRGYTRRTVAKSDILCAVLLDEMTGRVLPNNEAVAKAKADSAKKIARVINRELAKSSAYYRDYYMPNTIRTPRLVEDLCTQAL